MKKIPKYLAGYTGEYCWMCGRNGMDDPLETHHIFNGPNRKKSERYGLTVKLCACSCHNGGPNSVHKNQAEDLKLKKWGQQKAMEENDWSIEDFIREFGKNYLDEEEEPEEDPEESGGILNEMEKFAAELARKRREAGRNVPAGCFEQMP